MRVKSEIRLSCPRTRSLTPLVTTFLTHRSRVSRPIKSRVVRLPTATNAHANHWLDYGRRAQREIMAKGAVQNVLPLYGTLYTPRAEVQVFTL